VAARGRAQSASRDGFALGERALALVRGLPNHSLVDRLVRGRAWIPVLGVLLAGIVFMQVEILKLGTSMGRAMERSSALQTRNESLQASVATLADDQRIERLAAGMGMVMPRPDSFVFLSGRSGAEVSRALANIHAPDPVGFTNQLAAEAAAAAALLPPPPPAASASTSSGATTSSATGATPLTDNVATSSSSAAGAATAVAPAPAPATSTSTSTTPTSSVQASSTASGAAALAPSPSSQSASGGG
jgi:cell division protein FtsL